MIDPKQALLARVTSLVERTSATILWKYTDEDGKDFYLSEKKVGTLKSPYSGKSFTAKPERSSLSDVGKELKEDDAKVKGSLWSYVDGEGKTFYLPERVTGTLKSPYTGKSFTPKADKMNFGEINKAEKTAAAAPVLWKYVGDGGETFYLPEKKMGMVRSPLFGDIIPAKPTRAPLSSIAKDLRMSGNPSTVIWEYADKDGKKFYLDARRRGTLKSPYTGQSFQAEAVRLPLGDVGQPANDPAAVDPAAAELEELQDLLQARGYNPADAAIFQSEGMGPTELESRLDDEGSLERSHGLVKLAGQTQEPSAEKEEEEEGQDKTASLGDPDKKVVRAFYKKSPAEGKMLTTDGKVLEKNGLGGSNFAKWEGDKIVIDPTRPHVKSDEDILRYMRKYIPSGSLAPHDFFGKSAKVAEEFITRGPNHPAIVALKKAFDEVVSSLSEARVGTDGLKNASTQGPEILMAKVQPQVQKLAEVSALVAKQMEERLT
jgi:hypothetical protein